MMNSSMIGSSEMTESREQTIKPMMTSSWLETIKNYSELEGDSAIFSQDSVECLNWNTQDTGRAESPLRFDHEEVLRIDSSIEVCRLLWRIIQPAVVPFCCVHRSSKSLIS
jgi:hypothetical protein